MVVHKSIGVTIAQYIATETPPSSMIGSHYVQGRAEIAPP